MWCRFAKYGVLSLGVRSASPVHTAYRLPIFLRICRSTNGASCSTLSLWAKPEPVSMCRPEKP